MGSHVLEMKLRKNFNTTKINMPYIFWIQINKHKTEIHAGGTFINFFFLIRRGTFIHKIGSYSIQLDLKVNPLHMSYDPHESNKRY